MNEVLINILTRRSIRLYEEDQIFDTDLNLILEAAKYAPSGSDSQSWHFTVIQNKEKLQDLNTLVKESYRNVIVDQKTYRSIKSGKKASEKDKYNFYYNAPTLIIVSNDRKYPNAVADCSASIQNIFLASHSLGLGSCWINQLTWFGNEPHIRRELTNLGIPEKHVVCGSAAIGYKRGDEPKPSIRKEHSTTIIK
ncbi:putative NAD(P)H nitroreductase [Clostridium puniceum]|uniref:Putative NAD(P)H nitroreductase n=1 Tax=Clostridium puniceum TaxID=29367 RepID=A0A1S8TAZ6_9CLOT|nr:nitroreductase [Clostridium puniceum]OOM74947.1 putative NAD(P)H nitroreductase [Clostridium puniceum]